MAEISICPDVSELEKFATGHLAAPELDLLVAHLAGCAECLARLPTISSKDTLVDALASAKTLAGETEDPAVARLIARLAQLGAAPQPDATPQMFTFACGACGKNLKVKAALAGKKVKCPVCAQVVLVPAASEGAGARSGVEVSSVKTIPPLLQTPRPAHAAGNRSAEPTAPPPFPETVSGHAGGAALAKDATVDVTQGVVPAGGTDALHFLAPPQQPDELGRLERYRILKKLGAGGMGMVFLGEDTYLHRKVAIKVMLPQFAASASARERFLREARSAASIEHEHIVPIFQVGEDNKVPFLAMPFLKGEPLDVCLERAGKLPLPDALRIAREMAEGLAAAHANNLIHRDIKPGNVWLDGKKGKVRLLDFGLARAMDDTTNLTQTGALVGTPAYMAPAARGDKIDGRADLFSLGCVLYLMLTGQRPFKGHDTISVLMALAVETPTVPAAVNIDVPDAVSDLTMRLLAKDAAARPASAQAVAEELAELESLRGPHEKEPGVKRNTSSSHSSAGTSDIPAATKSAAGPRRRRLLPIVVAGLLLACVLGGGALGIIVLWATPNGTVRIEVADEDTKVGIDKGELTLVGKDGKEYRVAAGPHGLKVKHGAMVFDTENKFSVSKGDIIAFKIEVIQGKLHITRDGKLFEEKDLPSAVAQKDDPSLARKDRKTPLAMATLDHLDPAKIPAEERFPWQPKELVAVVGEHRGRTWRLVSSIVFSPDGKTIACGGDPDYSTTLFDAATLREKALLPPGVHSIAYLPDGKTMATVSDRIGLWLWDLTGAQPTKKLRLGKGNGMEDHLVLSKDGNTLAAYGRQAIRLWDFSGAMPKERPGIKVNGVHALAFAPDGKTLAAIQGGDNALSLWDISGTEPKERATIAKAAWHMAFTPDGKTLAFAIQSQRALHLWDVTAAKPMERKVIKFTFTLGLSRFVFAPDGKTLANFEYLSNSVALYDIAESEFQLRARITPYGDVMAFSPDGKSLAIETGPSVRIWDLNEKEPRERIPLEGHTGALDRAGLSPDGKTLATNSRGEIRLWDLTAAKPRERAQLRVPNNWAVDRAVFAPDGKTLATSWSDGALRLWDVTKAEPEEEEPLVFKGWKCSRSLSYSPDGKLLAGSDGERVRLLDMTGAEPKDRAVLKDCREPLAFSPDGTTFACRGAGEVKLWDLRGTEPIERAAFGKENDAIYGYAFSPDGKTFVSIAGNDLGKVSLWDVSRPQPTIRHTFEQLGAMIFSPDGKTMASMSNSGALSLWNAAKLKNPKLRILQLPRGGHISFAPDGRHLITANPNGTAYILRLRPAEEAIAKPPTPARRPSRATP